MRFLLLSGVIALGLVGCTAQLIAPEPPSGAELQGYIEQQLQLQQQQQLQLQVLAAEPVAVGEQTITVFALNGKTCRERLTQLVASIDQATISDAEVLRHDALLERETAECEASIELTPNEAGYYSTAQLGYVYDYFHDFLVPCLQVQGFEVGHAPSRAEFAAVAGSIRWDPYTQLGGDLPPSQSAGVLLRCPAFPPADFLASQ